MIIIVVTLTITMATRVVMMTTVTLFSCTISAVRILTARAKTFTSNAKFSRLKDLPVDNAHEYERQVEGGHGRHELIG
jgi:hypothetical protein